MDAQSPSANAVRILDAIEFESLHALNKAIQGMDRASLRAELSGHTPLIRCIKAAWAEGFDALLAAGADPDEKDDGGIPALSWALMERRVELTRADFSNARALLRAGADLDIVEEPGSPFHATTVLHIAASLPDESSTAVKMLLEHKPTWIQRECPAGRCALMWAAKRNNGEAASLLTAAGFDPNFRSSKGETPAIVAVNSDSPSALAALLAAGADPDAPPSPDAADTPLTLAVKRGQRSCVKVLLSAGADPLLALAGGMTALDHARHSNHRNSAEIRQTIAEKIALDEAIELRGQIQAKEPAPRQAKPSL